MTQIIFDHTLRMRVKPAFGDRDDTNSVVPSAPEATAQGQIDTDVESEEATAADVSHTEPAEGAAEAKPATSGSNMLGKINNLVTTDINTFELANDLLLIGAYSIERPLGNERANAQCG